MQQEDWTQQNARARHHDPASSKVAAHDMTATGRAKKQRAAVLRMVEETPGLTSAELAERHKADRHMLARRLPELRDAGVLEENRERYGAVGMLRTCTVKRSIAMTWTLRAQ